MNAANCLGNGWSIITSASTNSQLAGLLAGFVLTGILMFLGRPGHKSIRTLGLFCAAFIILGFDSYLFSSIAGSDKDPVCLRVWSEGMAASGMLAVGSLAIVCGIGWLLSTHIDDIEGRDHTNEKASSVEAFNLNRLGRIMVIGVATAVTLLLAITTLNYFDFALNQRVPTWLTISILIMPIGIGATAGWITYQRRNTPTSRQTDGPATALNTSTFGMLIYGVGGPVFAGILTQIPVTTLESSPLPIMITASVFGIVIPGVLITGLVTAFPLLRLDTAPTRIFRGPRILSANVPIGKQV